MHRYAKAKVLADALYGQVHLCHDDITGDAVAVKRMSMAAAVAKVSVGGRSIQEDISIEKHVNETLSANGGHPHILRMRAAFVEHGHEHFVLDFCPKGELCTVLDDAPNGLFDNSRARRYFGQIARGVEFVHRCGFAHRDLSLENVLVDADDNCHVCDFGLAVSNAHLQKQKVGKSYYMAPEVVAEAAYDASKTDVWSLGITLFIMLTGTPIFDVASHEDDRFRFLATKGLRRLVAAWDLDHLINPEAMAVLEGMLTVDPSLRWTMDAVIAHSYAATNTTSEDAVELQSPIATADANTKSSRPLH